MRTAPLFLIVLGSLMSLGASLVSALDVPEVRFSASSGKCVAVIAEGNRYPCPEELPSRYNHVWVR